MAGSITADNLVADTSSTLILKNGVSSAPPQFQDGAGTQIGTLCRAWVNFNGTGTVAIRAAFNVSSITDNGTCDYTINFTTAFSDVNYSFVGASTGTGVTAGTYPMAVAAKRQTDMLVGSCRVWAIGMTSGGVGSVSDPEVVNISVFR